MRPAAPAVPTRRRARLPAALLAWTGALLGVTAPTPAAAQTTGTLGPCTTPSEASHAACVETALGVRAARAALGLAAAGGADLVGTNSTLGKRIGSVPRVAVALRAGMTRAPVALLGAEGDPAAGGTAWMPSVRGDVGVGLFDGFSVAPTVGGILAVDVLGTVSWVGTSEEDGFTGDGVVGGGIGLRLGVFRESFTLPGVTVTVTRRWMGETDVGAFLAEDGPRGARFDDVVTSVRGVVGKDFFALGVLAGAGWDRYGGEATVRVSRDSGPDTLLTTDDFDADRMLVFGGVSWNFLVLSVSAEAGWAGGFDDVPGRPDDGFDPGASSWFGGLSLRLIL